MVLKMKHLDYNHEVKSEILPSRMAIIDQGRRQSGITNEKSVKYLQKSTRRSTEETYNNG
jgi:hypothetical protein